MVGLVGGRDSDDTGEGTLLLGGGGEPLVEGFDVAVQLVDPLDRLWGNVVDAFGTGGGLEVGDQGVALRGQSGRPSAALSWAGVC